MRALLDLLAPATCAGCGRVGALACAVCCLPLAAPASLRWPTPTPPGLPPPFAVAAYDGSVRRLVVAYKDRDALALRRPLARALTAALSAALAASGRRPVLLVPMPSSPRARRQRGYEPVLDLARLAARTACGGSPLRVVPMLEHARGVRDSAGLSATDRMLNLQGALRLRAPARPLAGTRVVLVDDVVTTGATLAEGARALREGGFDVVAAAVVAATARRS